MGIANKLWFNIKGEPEIKSLSPNRGGTSGWTLATAPSWVTWRESSGLGQAGVSTPAPMLTLSMLFNLSEPQLFTLRVREQSPPVGESAWRPGGLHGMDSALHPPPSPQICPLCTDSQKVALLLEAPWLGLRNHLVRREEAQLALPPTEQPLAPCELWGQMGQPLRI